jgi:hypothetical protein
MPRIAWTLSLALAAASLVLPGAGRATADTFVVAPPAVSCYAPPVVYAPAPQVSYYVAPTVTYYAPPAVTYYAPAVSYYAPAVSYYAAPTAVTTTRYGLFGRPRVSVTRYYP